MSMLRGVLALDIGSLLLSAHRLITSFVGLGKVLS